MLTREEVLAALRQQYPYLSREYGVRRIGLFGSFARSQPSETSDVDLVVELDRPLGLRFVELAEHLEALLGRKVDLLTPAGLASIRSQAISRSIAESMACDMIETVHA